MCDAVSDIEELIIELLFCLAINGVGVLKVQKYMGLKAQASSTLSLNPVYRYITYNKARSRHHFSLIVYLLAQVHRLQINGGSCTIRGLYYRDPQIILYQSNIVVARRDVCTMLHRPPWHLGILAAVKGLVAGDLQIYLTNGDLIDCNVYKGPISLPHDFSKIECLETHAKFVLVVEKETVFQSLLARDVFTKFDTRFILITGKGYPDFITRRIVCYLNYVQHLPVYIIVDADPYGIEIMLVYRYGSHSVGYQADDLACPDIRWIGIHPSEIPKLEADSSMPLNSFDCKKLSDLLRRDYLSLGVRQELETLQRLQLKAEIESVLNLLVSDYIPNKIRRNLFL